MSPAKPKARDWTRAPAKWAAAGALGVASAAGLAWSIAHHAPDPAPASTPAAFFAAPAQPDAVSRRIDVNTASPAELELLPRIGPALAERIRNDRDQRGPYRSVDDLERVRGIGPKTIDKLRPYATADTQ